MNLPLNLPLTQMQTQWSALINPVLSNQFIGGRLLKYSLLTGVNVINHGLGSDQTGWVIVDKDASVDPFRSQPLNNLTLTLTASAPVNVTLWVF